MVEIDDQIRDALAAHAEPPIVTDPSAIVAAVESRAAVLSGGSAPGGSVSGSGIIGWLGVAVVAFVGAALAGWLGLFSGGSSPTDPISAGSFTGIVDGAVDLFDCPDGEPTGRVAANARVVALARDTTGGWVEVRDPVDVQRTGWLPTAVVEPDAGRASLDGLPLSECAVVAPFGIGDTGVSGRIVDLDTGVGIPDVWVTAIDLSVPGRILRHYGRSDADGYYAIEVPAVEPSLLYVFGGYQGYDAGYVTTTASALGYRVDAVDSSARWSGEIVDVALAPDPDIVVETFSGVVRDAVTGAPLSGVRVAVTDTWATDPSWNGLDNFTNPAELVETITDADGRYSLDVIGDEYGLRTDDGPGSPGYRHGWITAAHRSPFGLRVLPYIDMTFGPPGNIDIALDRLGTERQLVGRVVDDVGVPIEGAWVNLTDAPFDGRYMGAGRSGPDGTYTVDFLYDEAYYVRVSAPEGRGVESGWATTADPSPFGFRVSKPADADPVLIGSADFVLRRIDADSTQPDGPDEPDEPDVATTTTTTLAPTTTTGLTVPPLPTTPGTLAPPPTTVPSIVTTTTTPTPTTTSPPTTSTTPPPTTTTTTTTTTTAPPNQPPTIGTLTTSHGEIFNTAGCTPNTVGISVPVDDPTGIASVTVAWSYPAAGGGTTQGTLTLSGPSGGGTWTGTLGPGLPQPVPTEPGPPVSLVVTATDAQGLSTSRQFPGAFRITLCIF